ncbi:hypothetical protein GCM10027055_09930 [Janibacter alkaliphilus]|uniref:DUF6801 domain-containing protein n=1 Tax=Janibacter alkaliphilus TaxID=1069963 RepID=A0A852X3P1_9MICO|nr:DUF6801 domain-containing protein [Janibacter alkaliphilus]NYG35940.1 hypothetical protein [Janibacter alkaliphilus]
MAKRHTTRISAGAAAVLGLGAAGIGFATPAQAVSADIAYSCEVSDLGIQFEDPWNVNLDVDVPEQVEPGEEIPAPAIVATVTPGADAQERLRQLEVQTVEGPSTAAYTVDGEERSVELETPLTEVPESGDLVVEATGTGDAETAPAEDGTIEIAAGDFTSTLTTDTGFVLNVACTAPDENAVGTIQVGEATEPEPSDDDSESPSDDDSESPSDDDSDSPSDNSSSPSDDTSEEPAPEVNDWFTEPSTLPITDSQDAFTVEGTASEDGTLTVQLLDADKNVLETYTWDVEEGSNSRDFDFVEGTDYVRIISADCVDANGATEEDVNSGCNVEYYAPWAEISDGSSSSVTSVAGDGSDDGAAAPQTPGVVQTDALQRVEPAEGSNAAAFALGGLLMAGAAAGSVVVVRRRNAAQH